MNQEIDEILEEASVEAHTQHNNNTQDLNEAPNSANVKVWIEGFGVMFTVRDNEMFNCVKKVTTLIQLFKEKNWQPSWEVKILPKTEPTQETPTCGIHGIPMVWKAGISKKTGKPYAFWSCSQKNADNSYCQYSPPKGNV